ncbi:CopG family transcriptional regulator [Moorella sp. E308F]|uniref:CopG family transcriptional regulator n=1 Tax=Moorella sp. E308F TaxID=2572682 RepID=UPI0010FFBDDA|nr:CopG family transcriptional regulator [Moorella sp. E308F]GEA14665.1 CopG family transcriptional regulator [Moorella sp. E308F]
MEYQNITLSLPKQVLQKVKHLAIERQTSVSGLLARTLEELVRQEDSYAKARERHTALLRNGFCLGTEGRITWRRADIHER